MHAKSKLAGMFGAAAVALLLHGFAAAGARAQTPQTRSGALAEQADGQRGDIYSADFAVTRPGGGAGKGKKYFYRDRQPARNRPAPPKGKVYVTVGITLGRGRRATDAELKDAGVAKVPMCTERREAECVRSQDMVVERIPDNTPVADGTPIQMIVEYLAYQDAAGAKQQSNRVGYLYVINRVQFPNNTLSRPRLIFPTMRTFGGDGRVLPGKAVVLPDPRRLWQITRNKTAAQAFEIYTLIISPEPLKDAKGLELQGDNLGATPLELDEKLVDDIWAERWGGGEIQSDLEQGLGRLFTKREQSAGGDPTQTSRDTDLMDEDLTQDDPPPQTVFRKVVRPGEPILVTIKLPFSETAATPGPKP
jgi:hypothetical protein